MTYIERYDWIRTSQARNNTTYKPGAWDWLYSRMHTCYKGWGTNLNKYLDPSDAGMVVYLLTGIQKTNPDMIKEIMENPVDK